MPKVSVIIPNYNHAPYLNQRIDSVLNQTFQDFEVIILDDYSNDNSSEIIEEYSKSPKISNIVYNEINSGSTFKQWDKGILLAKGEWIWIAESDDWCEPTFLESMIPVLIKNENCVLGYCQSYCISNENEIKFQSFHRRLSEFIDGKKFIKEYIITKNPIFNASMAVWRKDTFSNISKDFINYKLCGDWLFWIEVCIQGDVFISGKVLNYFRKHNKDVSSKALKSGLNFIESINILNSLLRRNLISLPEYKSYIKAQYFSFRSRKKELDKEKVRLIYKLFFTHTAKTEVEGYYLKKSILAFVKKKFKLFKLKWSNA